MRMKNLYNLFLKNLSFFSNLLIFKTRIYIVPRIKTDFTHLAVKRYNDKIIKIKRSRKVRLCHRKIQTLKKHTKHSFLAKSPVTDCRHLNN